MSKCVCCNKEKELRYECCFECAGFESLVSEKLDMNDKPIEKVLENQSESMNIVHAIINYARKK